MLTTPAQPPQRAVLALRRCPQLQGLSAAEVTAAAGRATLVELERDALLFAAGEAGADAYVIEEGRVAARFRSPEGHVLDLGDAATGDLFGYFEAIDGQPRSCDAVAVTPTTVWRLPAAVVRPLLLTSPATPGVVRDLLRIIRLQAGYAGDSVFQQVDGRVAGLLLVAMDDDGRVWLDGPQTLLAQRLGVARQTLHAFERDGLVRIESRGRLIRVLEASALRRLAGVTGSAGPARSAPYGAP